MQILITVTRLLILAAKNCRDSECQHGPLLCSKDGVLWGRNPWVAGLGDLPLEHCATPISSTTAIIGAALPFFLQTRRFWDVLIMYTNFKINHLTLVLQPEVIEEKMDTFYDLSFYLHNWNYSLSHLDYKNKPARYGLIAFLKWILQILIADRLLLNTR